jgi:alkylation response protein AidB-like acyl-CoA dehydrogenase
MFDFCLTADQEILRKEIIQFAQSELNQGVPERDREQVFPHELWLKCGKVGLQGLAIPEEYGGGGLDALSCAIAMEALGYGCHDGGLVFSICAHLVSCAVPIWKYGSAEQKRRYLPGLCDGSLIGVHAMSEPESGSDAFSLRTRARPDGDGFRLNGTKTFISNGPIADVVIAFALSDPDKGYFGGVTAFLVEKDTPGFRTGRNIEKMGLRTAPLGELVFEDVYAPADAILGGVGGGSTVFTHSMVWERICLFASLVGTTERLLERAVEYARTRVQFGNPIGKFQAISHRLADMKVRLEAARLLTYRAAWRLSCGKNASLDSSIAKLFVSESLVQAALDTVQICGAYGYSEAFGVERALRDAVASTIYSGTSEMQRNIIARWIGL